MNRARRGIRTGTTRRTPSVATRSRKGIAGVQFFGGGPMIGFRRRVAETVPEPGEYHDGPVYLRISVRSAGRRWPVPGFPREVNDHELENDDVHDWVRVEQNSRAAHAYRGQLVTEHQLPPRSVAVVRFRSPDARYDD